MVAYTYSKLPTANFNTTPPSIARSATGSVYDVGDTGFTTPLNMTLVVGGAVVTTISSDALGFLPDFTLLDRVNCVWKQTGSSFATVLTTSDPIPGPAGPNTVPTQSAIQSEVTTPGTPTATALTATYVPRWKANTAYLAGDKVLTPAGQIVSATANFTSGATFNAANWTYGSSARGKSGRSYAFVAGVLRNYDDGLGWQLVRDGFHPPIGITAVDSLSDTGLIRVDYPGLKMDGTDAGRTVTLLAQPDETLTKAGFSCGASVEPNVARIQLQQTRSVNDYLYWDTASSTYKLWKNEFWAAGRSPFTISSSTSNHVIVTHPQAVLDDRFDFGVDALGGPSENYRPTISTNTASTILTQLNIDFWSESLIGTKTVDWAAIGDGSSASTTVTVTGAVMGDFAVASMDVALPGGMVISSSVTAANTATVTLYNRTGATQDLASGTLRVMTRPAAGGSYRITTPDAKCKAFIRRGMMRSYVAPADVNETTYPSGNIWLIGVMQDQSLA